MAPLVPAPLGDAYAYGRIALGVSGLLAPGPVARAFGIGEGPLAEVAARHIAGRDLVGGLGIVLARRHGHQRGWYEAAALVDFLDAAIAAVAGLSGAMPPRRAALVALLASGSGALGVVLARQGADAAARAPAPSP